MDPSDNRQVGPSESSGHPPVYGRKRKTATRGGKKESTRSGGVSAPVNLLVPRNQDVDVASSMNVSSHYAIGNLDEKTDLGDISAAQVQGKVLSIRTAKRDNLTRGEGEGQEGSSAKPARGDRPSDASHENQISGDKHEDDQVQNDSSRHITEDGSNDKNQGHQGRNDEHQISQIQGDVPRLEPNASNVVLGSRFYLDYYDELQRALDRGHYTWCRQHCMKLLTEPRVPPWTRIQTLQLLSTLQRPAGAEQCLKEADRLIDTLNPEQPQTRHLREQNRKMKVDMMDWRVEHNLVGQDIEGIDNRGEEIPLEEPEVDVESADKATASSETC